MTRREFVCTAAATAATLTAAQRPKMGLATTSFMVRRPRETYQFLEYAHWLGAGGIQASLSSLDPQYIKRLRARAEQLGMYIEVMAALPANSDTTTFERTAAAAKESGAVAIRTACLSGRRYETFSSLRDWQEFVAQSKAAIDRALPIVEKHEIPLGIENHKDWTADELATLMRDKSSEHLGVCLDTGNNISLLDDPMTAVEMLAPFAVCTHIKDMALQPYEDGFLLAGMPLGEGTLDMKRIVKTIQKARPQTRLTLEMITRNPLKVPCLTDRYWVTFPDRNGLYLASTLRLARSQWKHQQLPTLDGLSHTDVLALELENVRDCLYYASTQLGL